jgi:hypothetical protein
MTWKQTHLTKSGGTLIAVLLLLLLMAGASSADAQGKPEITVLGGWMLNGSIEGYYGELDLPDAAAWGGAITVPVESGMSVEFSYTRQETEVRFFPYVFNAAYPEGTLSTASIQYFMLGGIAEKGRGSEKVKPFGLFQGGLFVLTPDDKKYDSVTKFALAFGGGLNIDVSEKIGLRMQGRLLLPMWFESGYVYAGSGGTGVGVSAGIPLVQGDFLGGLTFKF